MKSLIHSIKLPGASSCVMWTQANTPVFRKPHLPSSTRNRTPRNSSPAYLYTRPNPWLVVCGEPHECLWEKSSARFAWLCFMFSLLCTGSQCQRKAKPLSLSQSAFRLITMAPFARWSTYRCDDLPWCYFLAIVEFSGWFAQRAFGVLCTAPRLFFALSNTRFSAIRYTPGVGFWFDFWMKAALKTPYFAVCTSCVFCGPDAWRSSSCLSISCVFWPKLSKRFSVQYNDFCGVNLWTWCEIDNLWAIKSHSPFRGD